MVKKGDVFTRLTIIRENVEPPKEKEYAKNIGKWHECKCTCGKIVTIPEASLISGSTKSCGCYRSENSRKLIAINREQMKKNGNTTRPKTKTYRLEVNGEVKSLTEWANTIGITKQALSRKLKKMSLEEVLSEKERNNNEN